MFPMMCQSLVLAKDMQETLWKCSNDAMARPIGYKGIGIINCINRSMQVLNILRFG